MAVHAGPDGRRQLRAVANGRRRAGFRDRNFKAGEKLSGGAHRRRRGPRRRRKSSAISICSCRATACRRSRKPTRTIMPISLACRRLRRRRHNSRQTDRPCIISAPATLSKSRRRAGGAADAAVHRCGRAENRLERKTDRGTALPVTKCGARPSAVHYRASGIQSENHRRSVGYGSPLSRGRDGDWRACGARAY